MSSRAEFLASLPRKRVTAGAVIRDESGHVLLVEPTDKEHWLTPGGTVESDEFPAHGAAREVLEELGIPLPIGRALVMQWVREDDDQDGVLHFAYDGGVIARATIDRIRVPPIELRSYRFFEPSDVPSVASPVTAVRVEAALAALANGTFTQLGDRGPSPIE